MLDYSIFIFSLAEQNWLNEYVCIETQEEINQVSKKIENKMKRFENYFGIVAYSLHSKSVLHSTTLPSNALIVMAHDIAHDATLPV